jgi:hypothetical protein
MRVKSVRHSTLLIETKLNLETGQIRVQRNLIPEGEENSKNIFPDL